ncbi:Phosphatidic acid phosphatase type 2/haloperoxidase [Penicillium samsonianum]|uniref:Phosphatidic acid phosphatase type 2/haloperoxidase n=1 Tax=Penicillium samsonianum TaxID=1882272 RepID=UPI0025490C40|nr:Phosphatidic acid phosphatase type 2/haloperoxidase [Penicillium samsonianum]KAJ6138193.1 Phosphatidic acid phosphatase type 2/haloperoxidase [Penicillium samsonianum]
MEIPAKLPFSKRRLRPRVVISYIFDYVIIVACVAGFAILNTIEPFHQHFSLNNISIQYPYAVHERIPMTYALCISGAFPLALIIIYTLFIDGLFSHNKPQDAASGKRKLRGPHRWKDRLWELNCGILGLLLAQGLAFVITQALKNACGKPRPDLIDRCQPRAGSKDLFPGLSNSSICTGDPALLTDGFRSWPSGHSSSSFAGLVYTSLWLGGKLHVMDNRGEAWKALLVMAPLLAATLVAVSRIMDARHHPFDVITGSMLGIACGFVAYRQYFPPLTEAWRKGRAYPIRTWGTDPAGPDTVRLKGSRGESSTALHNLEEERMDQPDIPSSEHARPDASNYLHGSNPYASNVYNRRPHDHAADGGAWSSSEDDVTNGYEMRPGHTMGQHPGAGHHAPQYDPSNAYVSQTQPLTANAGIHVPDEMSGPGRPLTDMPGRAM